MRTIDGAHLADRQLVCAKRQMCVKCLERAVGADRAQNLM